MAVITTGNHPRALWPGVAAFWNNANNGYPREWPKAVHDILSSDKRYELVVQDTGFGMAPVKQETEAIAYQANVQGYTTQAVHVTYGLGYIVSMEELMDNLYEEVSMARAQANAYSQYITQEYVVAQVFNNGFDTNFPIGDGAAFFSLVHPYTNGGTFANTPTVQADLAEATLEDALIAIAGFKNDNQLQINIQPEDLMVARQNIFNAKRILASVYQNDTANNAINAMREMNSLPGGFHVNHFLTDTNSWFVKNKLPGRGQGVTYWKRMELTFDKDNDFNTKNAMASSIQRFSVAVADPRGYYGSSGVA